MTDKTTLRMGEMGIELPPSLKPIANFVPVTIVGSTVYVSGQLAVHNSIIQHPGQLGRDVSVEHAQAAARLAALHVVSQLSEILGGRLDRVQQCVRLGVFVAATADFIDHPKVANGASDLIVEVFQERGQHARAAVGVASLPFGASVEVDAIFQLTSKAMALTSSG
jgi:enamine deaminase RidA (YjgF/YER057c/UK114 family)